MEIEDFYKENNFIGWTETSAKEGLMVNDSMRLKIRYNLILVVIYLIKLIKLLYRFLVEVMLRQTGYSNSGNGGSESTFSLKSGVPEKSSCGC
jgi:hypothetical protein